MSDTRTWDKIMRRIRRHRDEDHVRVGVLGEAADADHGDVTVLEIAVIHEYGAPAAGIPQRSFILSTVNEKQEALGKLTAKLVKKIISGSMTEHQALTIIGEWMTKEIKNKISRGRIKPPLLPATIIAKGSSKPLVDTGRLLMSITYEVHA